MDITSFYLKFLSTALKVCLKKIYNENLSKQEKKFAELFFVIAYYRIPEFRNKFLNILN